jgi:5,6-dimethylbenzimidazole synthase
LPPGTVERLISIACLSPSVGLSEPWRFVVIEDAARRAAIRQCFETCNADAFAMQTPDRAALYARLKLAGLDDAPGQVAVFADHATAQGNGLGRLTMPQTLDYSVAIAIHTLWLAARAEGLGVGWVSILDPARIAAILDVPQDWRFIGHLCVGYPVEADDTPALERAGWERRHPPANAVLYR